jgi:hypothetical protein
VFANTGLAAAAPPVIVSVRVDVGFVGLATTFTIERGALVALAAAAGLVVVVGLATSLDIDPLAVSGFEIFGFTRDEVDLQITGLEWGLLSGNDGGSFGGITGNDRAFDRSFLSESELGSSAESDDSKSKTRN